MNTCLGKSCFIWFTASAFRKLLLIYVFRYFPFGFEGRMWELIVSVPDHCLFFYFAKNFYFIYPYVLFIFFYLLKKSIRVTYNS